MVSLHRSAASGRAIGDAQHNGRSCRPDAHPLALFNHNDNLAPGSVTQRLHHFKYDRVAQGRIGGIKTAFTHHPLGELAGRQLIVLLQMAYAQVGDLALFKKAMADNIARALTSNVREHTDRRVHMGQVVLSLTNLRLIRGYLPVNLSPLVAKRFNDRRFFRAPNVNRIASRE